MDNLLKFPQINQQPALKMIVEIYPDGQAQLSGVPNNPMVLLEIIRMLSAQCIKVQTEAQRQAAGGLVLPVRPISREPINGI